MIDNEISREEFLRIMGRLYDSGQRFVFKLDRRMTSGMVKKRVGDSVKRLAEIIEADIATATYPFDGVLTCIRRIRDIPKYNKYNPHMLAKAMKQLGCSRLSQVYDESFASMTVLWTLRDHERVKLLLNTERQAIFNGHAVYDNGRAVFTNE